LKQLSPHDIERFATFIGDFLDGCGFEPPFHVITISANGSVAVTLHTESDVVEVCDHTVAPGFVAPITVTIIAPDGRAKSAKIAIEAARGRMQ
jgi:hypothetical protein